jgi:carbon storage regulator CsrA
MLVLSRRKGEKIVFPTLGVKLEVLKVQGNTTRLGIEAPRDVKILRDELSAVESDEPVGASNDEEIRKLRHALRNRLNTAMLGIHLLKRQLDAGRSTEADATFDKLVNEFQSLEEQASRMKSSGRRPGAPPRRRTLIVEDDVNESELLAGLLRMNGFEVTTADDGEDALDYLSNHPRPDVVLLDMLMPRCNGPQTLQRIREDSSLDGMKVFAISGTEPASLGVSTGPDGVDLWFQKPVNPERLVQVMSQELAEIA